VSLEGDVEVTIRHVQSAAALAQLMCELGYETRKSDMQMRVARLATDERYRTFVAVRDGKVCGMIARSPTTALGITILAGELWRWL
jgi:hypothetical protein